MIEGLRHSIKDRQMTEYKQIKGTVEVMESDVRGVVSGDRNCCYRSVIRWIH